MRHRDPLVKNAYQRRWRRLNPLTKEQRRKDTARSYAGVYLRRGLLKPKPCEFCGSVEVQMHHDDYDQPLVVRWLCAWCHNLLHKAERYAESNRR